MDQAAANRTLGPEEGSEQLGPVYAENSDCPGRKETSRSPNSVLLKLSGHGIIQTAC